MPTDVKPGEEFLGVGLIGPISESHTGDLQTASGAALVMESWKAILSTQSRFESRGTFVAPERFMRDLVGCNLKMLKHENADDSLVDLMQAIIADALTRQEPRATITGMDSKIDGESIQTIIYGKLVGTNQPINLVVIRNSAGKIIFKT